MINKDAINDFYSVFNYGPACFYIITASPSMQKQVADSFIAENASVYNYSGKENTDTFSPKDLLYFIEANKEKEAFFILNFQIPFLGKHPSTEQPDYFALNLCRDVLGACNKKIFFFTTKEIEYNISIAAMDFFDYCLLKINFEDEKKEEIELQIETLSKDYDNINHIAEIEYRLNLYKDKIEEYLNIDIYKYCNAPVENAKTLTPIDKKSENYLLVVARDLGHFAGLYVKISNFNRALELLNRAFDIYVKILGLEHSEVAMIYNNTGYVYDSQSNYLKALEYFKKALRIEKKVLGNEHPDMADTLNNMGYVYYSQANYSKALVYYQKALKIREKAFGNEHPVTAISYNNIGAVYGSQGDYSKALEYHQKSLKIREKAFGSEHPATAISYNNIGDVYDSQSDYSKALEYFNKSLKIQKKTLGDNHPDTINTYDAIEKIMYLKFQSGQDKTTV